MAEKSQLDRDTELAVHKFEQQNPGQHLGPADVELLRKDIAEQIRQQNAIKEKGTTVGQAVGTTLTTAAYATDGATLFKAGAAGSLVSQGTGFVADTGRAAGTLLENGLLTRTGWRALGEVAGRASIPLTVGMGAYDTYSEAKAGHRTEAYQAAVGTGMTLAASITAGVVAGTMVTPLVGTIVGAAAGVIGYYGGRWLGKVIAEKTDPKKDFTAAASPVQNTDRLSVARTLDNKTNEDSSKSAFREAGVNRQAILAAFTPKVQAPALNNQQPVFAMNYS